MATTGNFTATVNVNTTLAGGGLGSAKNNVGKTVTTTYAAGTAAGQTDEGWTGSVALAISTPQTLDLTALSGEGGRAVSFSKIKYFEIHNTHATATLTVGNATSNQFLPGWSSATNTQAIGPGGVVILTSDAGFTVDGTHSDLKLDPGATAITAEIVLMGND